MININTNLALTSFSILLASTCIMCCFGEPAIVNKEDTIAKSRKELSVKEQYYVPIQEVSGLALAHNSSNSIDIYAIGDASYDIDHFSLKDSSHNVRIDKHNVADIINKNSKDSSQWEAIATDGKDNICILAEVSSKIFCLNSDLKKERSHFKLDVSSIKSLKRIWDKEPNSRGEGMILMKKGHILLLKEKKPSLLIEFGPNNDAPLGYDKDSLLQNGTEFDQPKSGYLVALKIWEFSKNLVALAKDASDITVGPDQRIYILSDENNVLIRLEEFLKPDEAKVHASEYWKLPKQIEHAEGLVIDNEMHPWVSCDIKKKDRPNIFHLIFIDAF